MCDDMPMDKGDVTCPYCWWRGKRHPYWREKVEAGTFRGNGHCPRCDMPVSDGWLFKTVGAADPKLTSAKAPHILR